MAIKLPVKRRSPFDVTEQAIRDAKAISLGGNVRARLRRMVSKSAPITHEFGNRRYEGFVLLVQDKAVVGVDRL